MLKCRHETLHLIGRYKSGVLCFGLRHQTPFVDGPLTLVDLASGCICIYIHVRRDLRKVPFGNRCQEQVRDMLRFSLVQVGDRCQHL